MFETLVRFFMKTIGEMFVGLWRLEYSGDTSTRRDTAEGDRPFVSPESHNQRNQVGSRFFNRLTADSLVNPVCLFVL